MLQKSIVELQKSIVVFQKSIIVFEKGIVVFRLSLIIVFPESIVVFWISKSFLESIIDFFHQKIDLHENRFLLSYHASSNLR